MNKSEELANHKLADELISAAIIRRSIDLPNDDVSLNFIALSNQGTLITEIEISFKFNSVLREYAELSLNQIEDAQAKSNGGLFSRSRAATSSHAKLNGLPPTINDSDYITTDIQDDRQQVIGN